MSKKAFIVTGLGFGDEGKGTITHWLACGNKAHTVIRTGGPQALHRVVTKDGREQVFSQFGSGTFRGSATHLSKHMLVQPHALLVEAKELKYEHGVSEVFELITIHEDALVITPFHIQMGRIRELMRGSGRRGSVGMGVGETILHAEAHPDEAIRAKDFLKPISGLTPKLEKIKHRFLDECYALGAETAALDPDVQARIREELAEMHGPETIPWMIERCVDLARRVQIVNDDFVATKILKPKGRVVFEGSQGVLLDRYHGFHPYTTKVRTTPEHAKAILRESGYDGEVRSLGILRAYHTRHGGGPFVTESADLTARLPDATNKVHAWQGNFRVGHFDVVAARYAIEACGPGMIDGVVITCLDRVWSDYRWRLCEGYDLPPLPKPEYVFRMEGKVAVGIKPGAMPCLARQEKLGELLGLCRPRLTTVELFPSNAMKVCASLLGEKLGLPIAAISRGEREVDKVEMQKGSC